MSSRKKKFDVFYFRDGQQPVPVVKIENELDVGASFAANHHSRFYAWCRVPNIRSWFKTRQRIGRPTIEVHFVRRSSEMPQIELSGTVECDEVYVVAGHKGHSESVKKRAKSQKTQIKWSTWPWNCGDG